MTDRELQTHIQNALDWDPSVDAARIGVSVEDGVATLRGAVATYTEKLAAERVAVRVYGVKGVANDIEVHLRNGHEWTDTDIAQAAVHALQWNTSIPAGKITVAVNHGWVTLNGRATWDFQREAAALAVRHLAGVRGVTTSITVDPEVSIVDVKAKIEAALKRSAEVDARRINVAVTDHTVVLSGNVHSRFERSEARRAAWSAPGVIEVNDQITIVP